VEFKSLIITNVQLPNEVANSIQDKTIFQFRNTLERKKQSYELRTINDTEEIALIKEIRRQERQAEEENYKKTEADKQREMGNIKAKKEKIVAEINENAKALISNIDATADLKYSEIQAEARLIENDLVAQGRKDAAQKKAEADALAVKTTTEAEKEAAKIKAQAIALDGEAEKILKETYVKKREHLQRLEKIKSVAALSGNSKVAIFGDQKDNLMAQVQSFKMIDKS